MVYSISCKKSGWNKDQNCFIASLNLCGYILFRRNFRHFGDGSESICRSLWSFRSCLASKDNNSSAINNCVVYMIFLFYTNYSVREMNANRPCIYDFVRFCFVNVP